MIAKKQYDTPATGFRDKEMLNNWCFCTYPQLFGMMFGLS